MLSYTDTRGCMRAVTRRRIVCYHIIAFRFDDVINTVSMERGCPLSRHLTSASPWFSILLAEKKQVEMANW